MFDRVLNPPLIFRSKKLSRSLVMPHNILWKLPPFITFYKALQSDVKNRTKYVWSAGSEHDTAQKMKFSIKDFFSFFRKLRIWSHLLKKSLMEKFISCTVPNQRILIKQIPDLQKTFSTSSEHLTYINYSCDHGKWTAIVFRTFQNLHFRIYFMFMPLWVWVSSWRLILSHW